MIIAESGFSKFKYQLYTIDHAPIGTLTLPTYLATPRNSPFSGAIPDHLKDCVRIELHELQYRIEYDLLSDRALRGNDLRFVLMAGDNILASADVRVLKKIRWEINMADQHYELRRKSRWTKMHFDLEGKAQKLGQIRDITGFTLWNRRFEIDLTEEIPDVVQIFLFFLAINATFR